MPRTMPRRLLFWGFRPAEEVHGLGTLERQILDVVWRQGRSSVRDVLTALDHSIAYTTAMTVMDRLFKKGVLDHIPTTVFAAFPKLEGVHDAVGRHPKIVEWRSKH